MSNAETRQAIAEAMTTVAGITGYPTTPSTPRVGDAWPQWRGAERAGGSAYTNTWNVLVVLPQDDEVTADGFADTHFDDIHDALEPVLFIDGMQPAEIPVSDQSRPMLALLITGRSE